MTLALRRKLKPLAEPSHLNGVGYAMIMETLGYDHNAMAAALGVTKWTSVAWKSGRRNITQLTETALRGLLLRRYAGDLAAAEADRVIIRAKQRSRS